MPYRKTSKLTKKDLEQFTPTKEGLFNVTIDAGVIADKVEKEGYDVLIKLT